MSTERSRMILDLGRHASDQARAAILRATDLAGNDPAVGLTIALVVAGGVVGAAAGFLSRAAEAIGETTDQRTANIEILDHLKTVLGDGDPERLAAAARKAGLAR